MTKMETNEPDNTRDRVVIAGASGLLYRGYDTLLPSFDVVGRAVEKDNRRRRRVA